MCLSVFSLGAGIGGVGRDRWGGVGRGARVILTGD